MFEKIAKWLFPKVAEAATIGATGGVSLGFRIGYFIVSHLPEIILSIALIVVLSMYGCEKRRVESLIGEKSKLEETIKAKDAEIAKLGEEVAFQKELVDKRTAELGITKAALEKQGAIEAETETVKKEKDEILDKWLLESDPKKKAELEAAYWNKVFGIKATVDPKTNKIKLLGPMPSTVPAKKKVTGGGGK